MAQFFRRHLAKILLAAGLLLLLLIALRPTPLLVDSETVDIGPVVRTIEEEGKTRVAARFLLSAPLAAEARRITHAPGDPVAAGETVAVLDALAAPALDAREIAAARARVEGAAAALEATERERQALAAGAKLAAEELKRSRQLADSGLIAASELDAATAEAERSAALERSAAHRVRVARYELEAARTVLAYAGERDAAAGRVEIKSPVEGVVLRRYFESARVVTPGEPIIEIADPASLEIEADLLSADAVRLEPGMRVLLERWGADDPLEGRVRLIEPGGFTRVSALGVEEQRVLVIVDLISPREQWQRLGDAYRVNARFILWEAAEIIRVPAGALFRHRPPGGEQANREAPPAWAVFVLVNGRARLRPVQIGERGGRYAQVLAGLDPGETVIIHPPRDLEEGDRVRRRGGG
ncbi:efflux RND transporter periplasmic adaptor subunit [Desulfurivibrio sp. D14AmB]|uniref:efflux RND transporter periplasmic adaptor subunit n=1 Tax=Desulfurivibrio sp. D14AmB TaxID=3374370 RepID=UPI00376ED1C4